MPGVLSVVIIDDHQLVADGVAAVLAAAGDVVVAAVAGTCADGLREVERHQPDVCLLDQQLPDGVGTDLLPRLLAVSPGCKVLMVSGADTDEVLHRAMAGGCVGFVAKVQGAKALLEAVRLAASGETVLTNEQVRRLVPRILLPASRLGDDLTAREREVLGLLAHGRTTDSIAKDLDIARVTARNYIQAILAKLGVHSKLEAVTVAIRANLVPHP